MNSILLLSLVASRAYADDPANSVTMDLSRFFDLYEASKTRPPEAPNAPAAYTIDSARFDGRVVFDGDDPQSAVLVGKLHIEALDTKNWVRVPVLPGAVALQSAKLGGAEAPLILENGWYTLVTNQKGPMDLELRFAVSVWSSGGASGFSFEMPPSAANGLVLAIASADSLAFDVGGAQLKTVRASGHDQVLETALPANAGVVSASWQRKAHEEHDQAARVYSEVQTLVSIGDGVLHATVNVQDTILFHDVSTFETKIPDGYTLLDVRGSGIRDWTQGADGVVHITLNYAAEGSFSYALELEKVVGSASTNVVAPVVEPLGVERSKGWLGVTALGNLEIASDAVAGATPVDVRTLPAMILGVTTQPVLLGFKYLGGSANIPLAVHANEDVDVLVTVIDQAIGRTMFTADGRRLTSVRYDVRNNRRQFLRLGLPDGAQLWSASVAGNAVQPAKGADGRILIPLIRSQAAGGELAAFEVEVVYVETGDAPDNAGHGTFAARLPTADAPSTYVGWLVYAPWAAHIQKASIDGTVRHVDALSYPLGTQDLSVIDTETSPMQQNAESQIAAGALGQGAAPVAVRLPLDGQQVSFEKLLAIDEPLEIQFDYSGLKH